MIDLSSYVEKPMDNGSKAVFYGLIKEYNQLQTQEKFAIIMLSGWIVLESYTNRLFLEEYGIHPCLREGEDKEKRQALIDTLEEVDFETKCQLLKKNGIVSLDQYKAISNFQYERNRLFHASSKNEVFKKLNNRTEQAKLIEASKIAFDAIYEAVAKYYDSSVGQF